MSLASNVVLAFSLSADAFAASIGKGTRMAKPRLSQALYIGAIFGLAETIMPVLGWLLGKAASQHISEIDHWVAFIILAVIGSKMVFEGLDRSARADSDQSWSIWVLALAAIGTSVDSMAVGVTLALMGTSIWVAATMMGGATFIMSTIGIMAGQYLGMRAGGIASIIGGLCLIAIGTKILLQHMGHI